MDTDREIVHAHDESASRGARASDEAWFHFTFSTYGAWIRGDARGFRDHDHRVHSTGDYRNPPPEAEHAELRRWVRAYMHKEPVTLGVELRERVGRVLVAEFHRRSTRLIALAVLADHVHGLARMGADRAKVLGLIKGRASHAVRGVIPGAVWGKRAHFRVVGTATYQREVFGYIVGHRDEGGWIWTYRQGAPV